MDAHGLPADHCGLHARPGLNVVAHVEVAAVWRDPTLQKVGQLAQVRVDDNVEQLVSENGEEIDFNNITYKLNNSLTYALAYVRASQ